MKNKKGLIGAIFLAIIIVLFLIGFFIYSQVKKNGLTVSTGDVTIKINYNKTANNQVQNNNSMSENFRINETAVNETLGGENNTFMIIEEVTNQSQ